MSGKVYEGIPLEISTEEAELHLQRYKNVRIQSHNQADKLCSAEK